MLKPAFNETNPISRTAGVSPAFPAQLRKTNPIPVRARHAVPPQCETNPISPRPTANRQKPKAAFAKRTQSHPRRTCGGPKNRNEPNFPPQTPIYELQTTNYELFMQNEPNPRTGTARRAPTMRNEPNFHAAAILPALPVPPTGLGQL